MIYLLPHTILSSADRYPDRTAFTCGKQTLNYEDTATQINQLASTLHQVGVRRGDRVGVFLNRSLETAIALHGIMRAGAAYVPLNPKNPANHIRYQIADCGIKVLISNQSQRINIEKLNLEDSNLSTIIGLPEVAGVRAVSWEEVAQAPENYTPSANPLETDLAYIMYTSGSTGRPKGIMHTHASGLAFARLSANLGGFTYQDRFANHAPIYFDISTLAYFAAPLVGAATVISTDAHTIFPTSQSQMIEDESITIWYSVPLALVQMLQRGKLLERDLSKLRWIFYAGEPFAPKYLRQLMQALPSTRVSNLYGPAETNVCTYYHLPGPPISDEPIPIGQSWANTETILLDEAAKELDPPATGELCVRSTTMMQAYWRNPERTAKAIYQRQGPDELPQLFYRTGDLIHQDEAGVLHFLGRKDNQAKIRGYRVEIDAVEAQIMTYPDIAQVAVLPLPDTDGTLGLIAAVVLNAGVRITEAELHTKVLDLISPSLPVYALPKASHLFSEFPQTGSGKVDRGQLKKQLLAKLA